MKAGGAQPNQAQHRGMCCWGRAGPSWDTTGHPLPPASPTAPGAPPAPRQPLRSPGGTKPQRSKTTRRPALRGDAWQEWFIGSPGTKSLGTCE